ncbi:RsmE family RNA methyltransferase [Swaminathania salitolerans]|uniref:Ribosomal RNA small subunit methyltransferase E n=1 Tax=Swaminathania salitolerans TaxID=182838 RepID=A0A511BUI1_9PROT|nr:RsmE family RNA methyltransferase [Swaminathania salitolerans]GBQ16161.1 16S ribosomal RNA methyltransferase RsmE [Swaminathania salitolerans LMG 21291]GEL01618.1 ribosomal RNA small subunit methyltransferase E [Swaminathania salitolerans]
MQDSPRLHLAPETLQGQAGETIALAPGHVRYLATVLRLGEGDLIRVFNVRAGEWEARLGALRKERGSATLVRQLRPPSLPSGDVTLLFAPLKRDATDLVIRMGTELGVTRFCPVVTDRTNTHRINDERLSAIAAEAAEQCERLDVPEIAPLEPLTRHLQDWPDTMPVYLALERHETGDRDGTPARPCDPVPESYGLLIGPEGGFSEGERRFLLEHPRIQAISLGALVLRADTAVATGLAQLAFRARRSI